MATFASIRSARGRLFRLGGLPSGFSLAETCLVLAVVAVVAVLATPMFLRYYHAAHLRVAAEEVAAFLNHGRHLGIKENVGVCVQITSTAMRYLIGGCAGTTWT